MIDAVGALNLRHGHGMVHTSTMDIRQTWQLCRDRLSPCYTVRLADVPQARF